MPKGIKKKKDEVTILIVHEMTENLHMSEAKSVPARQSGAPSLCAYRKSLALQERPARSMAEYLPQVAETDIPQK